MNTDITNDKTSAKRSRKDIIKNIAIIFLAVLLVLTFFSNTVMNMSLPQVSAQYASNGNISEQIRGSGVVSAGQSYDVMIDESRVISGVNVKAGDKVEKGDVLYTLEGKESSELEEAEKTLSDLQYEYRKAVIAAGGDTGYLVEMLDIDNAKEDIADIRRDLERFDDPAYLSSAYAAEYYDLSKLRSDISELEELISEELDGYSDIELEVLASDLDAAVACLDTDDYTPLPAEWYSKIDAAQKEVDAYSENDKSALTEQKAGIEAAIASLGTEDMLDLPTKYYERISDALEKRNELKDAYDQAESELKALQDQLVDSTDYDESIKAKSREIREKMVELDDVNAQIAYYMGDDEEALAELYKKARDLERELSYLNEDLADLSEKKNVSASLKFRINGKQTVYNNTKLKLDAATKELNAIKTEIRKDLIADLNEVKAKLEAYDGSAADSALAAAKKNLSDLKRSAKTELKAKLNTVNKEVNNRKDLQEKKTSLEKSESEFNVKLLADKKALEDSLKEKERSLESLEANLSVKKITDGVTNRQEDEDLKKQADDIERQRQKVTELKEKSLGGTITAPVSGTISSMTYRAGETTAAGNAAAVIDMTDKGFVLSFSVKSEQAKKLSVGTNADISNNYFGKDISAVLTAIKPDNANPQTSKLLEFTISGGDVQAGDSISLSIGAKGQDYPAVVPNSAVREDKNGKYVLVVESKSTALGSRYYAVRYPVEVLASNDSKTAVSGLTGSEFVVISSSTPIEEGQQVKLTENS
ncbi:MAG: HlyD family efflux transporter periplasmic adaptor subunit [Oscillospiraceae bacterium]|nr:HlyD family efflux transporter periplasmic adaptor subunit [Oscillospiraceae bacterium]MDY2847811.1 HlyD family efflux transporter periplasmic adaptor subunit [Oscillospiraceae bacterium]